MTTLAIFAHALSVFLMVSALVACTNTTTMSQQSISPTKTSIPTEVYDAPPTYRVQRGTVEETLSLRGKWVPRDQEILYFEIAGTVGAVNVRRDDVVTKGTVLAEYQLTDLERQREREELALDIAFGRLQAGVNPLFSLAAANLALQQTQNSSPWTSLETAEVTLQNARVALDRARRNYDAVRGDPVANSIATIEDARIAVSSAETVVNNAQLAYYSAAQAYNSWVYSEEIAENAVTQNFLIYQEYQEYMSGSSFDQEKLNAYKEAELTLKQTNDKIDQSQIRAPFDGLVLEVSIKPGDQIQPHDKVITLALDQPREVVVTANYNEIREVSEGLVGICELSGRPETAVHCLVRRVPATADDIDQTIRLAADFDQQTQRGQSIDVFLPIRTKEDVLWLPPEAIKKYNSRTFVVLQNPDGSQEPRDVELGLGNDCVSDVENTDCPTEDRVEIVSGLAEGDVVVAQ